MLKNSVTQANRNVTIIGVELEGALFFKEIL